MTIAMLMATTLVAAGSPAPGLDTAKIEVLTGAKGQLDARAGVFKVLVPRMDLKETIAGVAFVPAEGLGSWAAFQQVRDHTVVMGDLTLTENQVSPVMSVALDSGLEVTALHNHFLWDSPCVMFMHIGGMGSTEALASAVGKVLAMMKSTGGDHNHAPTAGIDAAQSKIDPAKVDAVLNHPGQLAGGVYKVTWGRETTMDGVTMGGAMGVNTWAAFAGTDDRAVVDGDFAMLEGELQGVLKALRHSGIDVVAIHQHMISESPRILFLHYWGVGPADALARAIRAARDTQAR